MKKPKKIDRDAVISTITRRSFIQISSMGIISIGLSGGGTSQMIKALKNPHMVKDSNTFEVIIIGGSYSGLSAGLTLGRSLRKTLIIDSGKPCNRQTPHSHNFITHDGRKPADIANDALHQVRAYDTIHAVNDLVKDVESQNQEFIVRTQSGNSHIAQKLLFATGVKDIMPDIPGFSQSWGITAIHCPYCHGYEVRGKSTGVLVNDESATEFARLVKHWTPQVTVSHQWRSSVRPQRFK